MMTSKPKPFAALTITRDADGMNTVAVERLDESMHENNCPFCMLTTITAMQQALLAQQIECLAAIAAKEHGDVIKKIMELLPEKPGGGRVH
jgi:hypothetical protein